MVLSVSLVLLLIVLSFSLVVKYGAPYVPTLTPQVKTALDLLDLKPGQTLIELGSGDGKVLKAAAKRGLKVVGYELNPLLVLIAIVRTWPYRDKVRVILKDFWKAEWPPTDGIFVFLLPRYMEKLNNKVIQYSTTHNQHTKLVSFSFKISGKKHLVKQNNLYLYKY